MKGREGKKSKTCQLYISLLSNVTCPMEMEVKMLLELPSLLALDLFNFLWDTLPDYASNDLTSVAVNSNWPVVDRFSVSHKLSPLSPQTTLPRCRFNL